MTKKKLTAAQKSEKRRRRKEYMTIFINGKQKRVKRPPMIDGLPVDEFIRRNADPVWLFQNQMYEELYEWEQNQALDENMQRRQPYREAHVKNQNDGDDLPFRNGASVIFGFL